MGQHGKLLQWKGGEENKLAPKSNDNDGDHGNRRQQIRYGK